MTRAGLALLPLALMVPTAALAQDNGRLSADVTASAGYSNNPFATAGEDSGTVLLGLDFVPRYIVQSERDTLSVTAAVRLQQYLERYGLNDNYSGAVDYSVRPSERLSAHTQISLSSAVLGAYDSYLPGITVPGTVGPDLTPGTDAGSGIIDPILIPPVADIGLFGRRSRVNNARFTGDIGLALSARDSATVSAYGEASRYNRNVGIGDYEGYGLTLGYSRQLSDSVSVGAQGSGTLYDYDFAGADSRVYSIQATASVRLSEVWNANGALGVSFVDGGGFASTTQTSLSGNLNLCRRGERSNMCVQASRQVRPTGLVGSQYTTSVGANWSLRLSERENVSWAAAYSKVGGSDAILLPGRVPVQNEFATFQAGYDRRLGQRLRLVASANVRQLFGRGDDRPVDYGGRAGLSYRLGDPR